MTTLISLPPRVALLLVTVVTAGCLAEPPASGPLAGALESREGQVVQLTGTVPLAASESASSSMVAKRFVLRYPASGWNGALVVGAHGGSGGNNYDPTGKVIGTDETALDDVIGRHAVAQHFAYASVDRDGAISAAGGLALTNQFADLAAAELTRRLGRAQARRYLLGLSMGGGIARAAAETPGTPYAGIIIVAGANGDLPARAIRQTRLAELWPALDPLAHPGIPDSDPKVAAFAAAIGTPVAARRLWPFTAAGAVRAAASTSPPAVSANSTGVVQVPTIEVAGTWDDFVTPELKAYRARVSPAERHRLYLVDGVWHMSGDDDGVQSFMYIASRMGLDADVARAMSEGPSYLPTVQEAFDRLVSWVERGEAPPPSQTVGPGQPLQP
ncbi:MAG: alpha/beta hydrolase [Acidobacteria bacterium]|nr:alpha/beta hydrolase [Acidobacteriota bacterium]